MPPLHRCRTLLALTGVVVLVGASLTGSPALAKCGKDCKRLITGDFITCKRLSEAQSGQDLQDGVLGQEEGGQGGM